jgi:nucleoside-diphosphate-sugar epimerase
MLIAITGGMGFIGRALAQAHIKRGDRVRILSRRPQLHPALNGAALYRGDLVASVDSLIPFVDGADILYHCAGEIQDPEKMHAVHVTGTQNLCAAASGRIGRWVQLSSVGTYGFHADGQITEETPPNPAGTYEITKTLSDEEVMKASSRGAFSFSILRPSNVYAADMTNQHLFLMIKMIRIGLFFLIGQPGASANYIHVANVAKALMLCGSESSSSGNVFNLSDHRTFEAFVAVIADELGCRFPILRLPERPVRWLAKVFGTLPGFPLTSSRINAMTTRCAYPIDKIQKELGYRHEVSMEAGIQELVRAWKQSR